MSRVRRQNHPQQPDQQELPLRWAFLLVVAGIAAAVAGRLGGPVLAISMGVAVLGVLAKIIGR